MPWRLVGYRLGGTIDIFKHIYILMFYTRSLGGWIDQEQD